MAFSSIRSSSLGWSTFLLVQCAQGGLIYQQNFDTQAPGPEWSTNSVATTPAGCTRCTSFLGEFGNRVVTLVLSSVPDHVAVTVDFDVYVIRSWDGNITYVGGPDIFGVTDGTGLLNFRTTFSNNYMYGSQFNQAYPGSYPSGNFPSQTGAVERQTLGYTFDNYGYGVLPEDAVYHLSFTFPHNDPSLWISFYAQNLSSLADESWGLDNVTVSAVGTPEPASFVLIVGGLLFMGAVFKRKHR